MSFQAVPGPASLRLTGHDCDLDIRINNLVIQQSLSDSETTLEVQLETDNTIEINVSGAGDGTLRITQAAEADLGLVCQGYFGLNTSDMEKQRAFYELLGFKGEIYPAGPETSTSFARSLGFADNYLIYVSLHGLQDPPAMPFVDTVQFRGDSFRDEPPYAQLNHIGMTYATYATTDLQGDYEYLIANGVEFLSPPTTAPNGENFTFMKDQDGAFIKLLECDGEASGKPNLQRLVNTNMNVTDLERSIEFYRLLGFCESNPNAQSGDGDFAAAHGFTSAIAFDGIDVSLGEGTDGATLQLRQWQTPFDDAPPYAPPVNHLGIDRINFYVKDLTAAIQTMKSLGFEPLGPIGSMPEVDVGITFFLDPDGIKVQLAGPFKD